MTEGMVVEVVEGVVVTEGMVVEVVEGVVVVVVEGKLVEVGVVWPNCAAENCGNNI